MTEPENKFPLTFTPLLQDSKSSFSGFTTSAGSWVLKTSCLRTGRSWWGLKGVDVKRHWGPSWPWLILLSGGREQLGSAVQHLCWRKCTPLVVPESAENGASFRACAGKGNASKTIEDVYRLEKSSCWWPWLWPWLHLTLPSLLSSLPPFCRCLLSKTSGCQALQWAVVGSTKQGPRPHGAYEPVSFYNMYVGGAGVYGMVPSDWPWWKSRRPEVGSHAVRSWGMHRWGQTGEPGVEWPSVMRNSSSCLGLGSWGGGGEAAAGLEEGRELHP